MPLACPQLRSSKRQYANPRGRYRHTLGRSEPRGHGPDRFQSGRPDQAGHVIARGLVNYDSEELPAMIGRTTHELAANLGAEFDREVVHRDDLIVRAKKKQ